MRLYILLDTSGSMEGSKIAALNDAMTNIVKELKQYSANGVNKIILSVLSFGKGTKWMNGGPIAIEEFEWDKLTYGGMTPFGKACLDLNSQLLSETIAVGEGLCIIVLSDGCPTDDYDEGIESLQLNERFTQAHKYAIAIGDNADIPSLLRFVGDVSHIFKQNKSDELLNIFQNIFYGKTNTFHDLSVPDANNDDDDEWS